MADAADSKSAGGNIVRVQVPPSALESVDAKGSCTFGYYNFNGNSLQHN